MIQRLYTAYLLFRVLNADPRVHQPAVERLKQIGKPVIKRALNSAMNCTVQPARIAAPLLKANYRETLLRLPEANQIAQLTRLMEDLARSIVRNRAAAARYGDILVSTGIEGWQAMLDLAAKFTGGGYERSAYQLIPLFVNRIPIEEFVTVIKTHPKEGIRNQAAIAVQKFDGFAAVRDEVMVDGTLLQAEQRYPDVFETALSALKKYRQAGVVTIFYLCEQPEAEFKQLALGEALRLNDVTYAEHFITAERSADRSLREMASAWLDQHSAELTPEQQVARTTSPDTPK